MLLLDASMAVKGAALVHTMSGVESKLQPQMSKTFSLLLLKAGSGPFREFWLRFATSSDEKAAGSVHCGGTVPLSEVFPSDRSCRLGSALCSAQLSIGTGGSADCLRTGSD